MKNKKIGFIALLALVVVLLTGAFFVALLSIVNANEQSKADENVDIASFSAYTDVEDEHLNNNSTQFHEHMGYKKVAQFNNCCIKFGKWYHLIWMEKIMGEHL